MTKVQNNKKESRNKKTKFEVTPKFERGIDYFNIAVLLFAIGSIVGVYWEQIYVPISVYLETGNIIHVSRTGLIYGPFSPIYGAGALIFFALIFIFRNKKAWQYFLIGSIISGFFEYMMSLGQEVLFGTRSWNYSNELLNINGRTTVIYAAVWGIFFLIAIYGVFPLVYKLYRKIPSKIRNIAIICLAIFLVFDITVSIVASRRQYERRQNIEASNFIERFCDKHYTDEYLKRIYENARPVTDMSSN